LFAFAALILAPVLTCGEALATEKKCFDRLYACHNRCNDAATKKYGTDSKKGPGPAADAAAACGKRTCDNQFNACVAAQKASKDAPLTPQQSTRSPTAAPQQPLTPQKVTRSPATVPAAPLTSQNTARSPASSPSLPLTSSPSLRRGGR